MVALDRFEEYTPGLRGEPAQLIFEGDLTNPKFISKFEKFLNDMSKEEIHTIKSPMPINLKM